MPTATMAAYKQAATHAEDSCKSPTLAEPRTPNSHIKKLSRTFSLDTTTSDSTWYSGTGSLLQPTKHEEDPPAYYESRLCSVGFVLKIVEWCLCILSTGLYFEGSGLVNEFKKQLFPYIVYWTYMMITGVIILSYLLGQKMREMLIRIYNILGSIMFLTAAIIIINVTVKNWEIWHQHFNSSQPASQKVVNKPKLAKMLVTQSILCFLNSFVYFADTVYSLCASYRSVTLHLQ